MARIGNLFNTNRINLGERIPLDTPLVIQLETSGYCNLRCKFCPSGTEDTGIIRDMMTEETFNLFISQCLSFPQKIKILRIIGIGEPMTNKKIVDFVSIAKKSGAFEKVEITSNGTLLTNEISDGLIEAGLDTLLISLEAVDEESFKQVAGVNIDLQDMYENLKYFYEKKTDTILYIKCVDASLASENDRRYFLKHYGEICDEIQIEHVIENWPEFEAGTDGSGIRYDLAQYQYKKRVCVQPFKLLCLAANGDVMPCSVDWKRALLLGNIHDIKLTDIWNGENLRNLRMQLLNEDIDDFCMHCSVTKANQPDDIDEYAEAILKRI